MKERKGFSFIDGLQLLFIGLKLREDIDWSWWMVFIPFFAAAALAIFIAVTNAVTGGNK